MNTNLNVALYVRVSTDMQVDGYSIDEQLERLEKYCAARDWNIYNKYVDPGFSGSNINRPGLLNLLKDVREHKIDLVLVYKLDRLSRSQKDTLYLIEDEFLPNNVDFVSMSENFDTSTPFGKAVIGILSVFAQLEREQIKERLAMGHIGRAKAGYWRGGSNVPIGYDFVDGKLIVNKYEALQIKKIYELFLEGETIHAITKYMHENYTNKYSSYADASYTGRILHNRLYIGKIKYKGVEYDGIHEPIIDEDTFNKVQQRYKEISSKWIEHYRSPYKGKQLLTGMLFCGNCGARYFSLTQRKKVKGKLVKKDAGYVYYKCYSRDGNKKMKKMDHCKNPTYRIELVNNAILDEIKKLKLEPGYIESIIQKNKTTSKKDNSIDILKSELEETTMKIDKLMDLYSVGIVPISDLTDKIKSLYNTKEKLEKQIETIKNKIKEENSNTLSLDEVNKILDEYVDNIDTADLQTQRKLVQLLIEKIEVGKEYMDFKIYWRFM